MIDEKKLIEDIEKEFDGVCVYDVSPSQAVNDFVEIVDRQPKAGQWIPCSERLPEERESIFKKAKGTDKWDPEMFESISDDVNVTVEFEDGTRKTMTSYTTDGKWSCEKEYRIKMKVIAWCPLPEPYKGE